MKQRHWVVDIGNTRIKTGLFEKGALLESKSFSELSKCNDYLMPNKGDRVLITSVKLSLKELKEIFSFPFLYFDHETPLEIKNTYKTPHTLGLDRLAGVIGARLPLIDVQNQEIPYLGTDTTSCMASGIYHGVAEEIKGFIQRYRKDFGHIEVFICGGDAEIFESLIKDHIFVIPNLVLYGLDRILIYNVEK